MKQHSVTTRPRPAARLLLLLLLLLLLSTTGTVQGTRHQCGAHELLLRCLAATHDPDFCTQPVAYAPLDAPDAALPFRPRDAVPLELDVAPAPAPAPPALAWTRPVAVTRASTDNVS